MILLALLQSASEATVQTIQAAAAGATDNPSATLTLAVIVPFIVQGFKNASWFPWVTRNTGRINFAIGVIAALATTLGIHATWDPIVGGSITGIPGIHGIWQAFVQWAGQQVAYKGLVVPAETLGDIRTLLERLLAPPPESSGAAKTMDPKGGQ